MVVKKKTKAALLALGVYLGMNGLCMGCCAYLTLGYYILYRPLAGD
jgi:hypothetical protein